MYMFHLWHGFICGVMWQMWHNVANVAVFKLWHAICSNLIKIIKNIYFLKKFANSKINRTFTISIKKNEKMNNNLKIEALENAKKNILIMSEQTENETIKYELINASNGLDVEIFHLTNNK